MNLAAICIRRPVFTLMMTLALVVLGMFSYQQLGLDLMPKMDFPIVRISVTLPGASPEEVETQIAKPIEEAVNTVGGIDELNTKCLFGQASIIVKFVLEKDIDVAAQEVRDRIARITKDLPEGTEAPLVEKMDPDAMPVVTLVIRGPKAMPLRDLTYFARKRIKEQLEAIDGVGAIQIVGGREREIRIVADAKKLGAYNISSSMLKDALKSQNVEIPGGNVTEGPNELILRTLGRIDNPASFSEVIITTQNGVPIRMKDIAEILDDEAEPRSLARLDGEPALSLVIQKQSGVNTLDVIDRIQKRLEELKKNFPAGISFISIRDSSKFIKSSLHELETHLVLGSLCASLVVLLFMGNLVSTFISALAIPVSLISTFLLMRLMGFTLNNMSMLGLTLAVGIVIDDAIVVLENIFRHIEEKHSDAETAANEATSEIYMAVMATSLSLAVIFLPVAFMEGIIGRFLNNFGLTIAFAILISVFVSFTLTPMLCSRFFRYRFARGSGHSKQSGFFSRIDAGYGRLLNYSLRHRWQIVIAAVVCVMMTLPIGKLLSLDFMPNDDTNEFSVFFRADEGSSLEGTKKILEEIEAKLSTLRGVQHVFATIGEGSGAGVNEGQVFIQLVDISERKFSQFDVMEDARRIMKPYKDLRPAVQASSGFGGGSRMSDTSYSIAGPDLNKINEYVEAIVEKIRTSDKIGNADSSYISRKPEVHVRLDRERAYRLGVRLDVLSTSLRTLVGGADQITRFKENDELYEVRVRLRPEDRGNPDSISGLLLPTTLGTLVRLDSVASVTTGFGPAQIDRRNRQRSITVNINLGKGAALGDVNKIVEQAAAELKMPAEYTGTLIGRSREMARTMRGFLIAFFMSAIFMYMILASQFESLLHPVTIMLSLPLSIPFALFSLLITGNSVNIYSLLGVFMLFGIVKKNAILQIDYTNTLREQGLARKEAVIEANHARFRPILMTTVTLIAGMLPMAFGKGAGAATRASMAITIIGGQSLCLLITLLLTPVAYTLFDDLMTWIWKHLPKIKQ
ncbi:MAG TPA: efflux RND transporter permease subunit [Candidatus Ozemobacteraceae bacterium]|nr:efflux RND transporter permease subunit [Candidatus Ozemobacteraceae bacterium]